MNYTIAQAIKKLSNHNATDEYFHLCRLIRRGMIQTCFNVYGVAIAVVKRCNRPLHNKEVVGIRFIKEQMSEVLKKTRYPVCNLLINFGHFPNIL